MTRAQMAVDTNMILAIEQFKVNIFEAYSGYEFVVPEQVMQEVNALAKANNVSAKIGQQALVQYRVKTVSSKGETADDALLELTKSGFCIATNDAELRQRIKQVNGKCIYIRKKRLFGSDSVE